MRRFVAIAFAALMGVGAVNIAAASAQQYWVNGHYRSPPGQGCGGFGCR
jgi:hypothetical protein